MQSSGRERAGVWGRKGGDHRDIRCTDGFKPAGLKFSPEQCGGG